MWYNVLVTVAVLTTLYCLVRILLVMSDQNPGIQETVGSELGLFFQFKNPA